MKKKGLFINLSIVFIVSIVFLILSSFNIFEKLDYRFYDSLINLKKAPPKTENILLVEIDNASIEAYGEWPWSFTVKTIWADASPLRTVMTVVPRFNAVTLPVESIAATAVSEEVQVSSDASITGKTAAVT